MLIWSFSPKSITYPKAPSTLSIRSLGPQVYEKDRILRKRPNVGYLEPQAVKLDPLAVSAVTPIQNHWNLSQAATKRHFGTL